MDMLVHVGNRDFGIEFESMIWRGRESYILSISSGGNTLEVSMTADQAAAVANAIAAELNKHIEGAG